MDKLMAQHRKTVLFMDVIDCVDGSGERSDCVDQLGLTNRTAATFSK